MTTTHMTTTEIAKVIRTDLKAAFPGVKFGVKTSYFAGGSSIDVKVKNLPEGVAHVHNPARVAAEHCQPNVFCGTIPWRSPEADDLLKRVKKVAARLHWDESDSMTDYFHCNFYLSVEFDWELERDDRDAILRELTAVAPTAVLP